MDRAGRAWEARHRSFRGAHAGNARLNDGNVGICVLGNFQEQRLTLEQEIGLERLLAALMDRFGLDRSAVVMHRELKMTSCPGEALVTWMESWRPGG